MALKLSNAQIEALVEKEFKSLQEIASDKIEDLRNSLPYLENEDKVIKEYGKLSEDLKKTLNVSNFSEETLKNYYFKRVVNTNLSPTHINRDDLRDKLIIATIDCDNLQEVLKNAGFTLTI